MEMQLQAAGLAWEATADLRVFRREDEALPDSTASFVDDLAAQAFVDPPEAIAKTKIMIDIVIVSSLRHGMQLNFGPQKTAVQFAIFGEGDAALKTALAEMDFKIHPLRHAEDVPVVLHYCHLGGQVTGTGAMLPEVKARAAMARAADRPINKTICKIHGYTTKQKVQYKDSLSLSRLKYNAQVWNPLEPAAMDAFRKIYCEIYRGAVGRPRKAGNTTSNSEALAMAARPTPDDFLRHARLVHLARLMDTATPALRAMLDERSNTPGSWSHELRLDLQWMLPFLDIDADPRFEQWADMVQMATQLPKN